MSYYVGIDLGTSSVKLILADEKGNILREDSETYPISYPKSGWSEQNPEDWFLGVRRGLKKLIGSASKIGVDPTQIRGISFGGQMHGLVLLDEADRVIRPAILWNDGRTQEETDFLNEKIGRKALSDRTGNIAFAGFTAPKILWVRRHEPENFAKISKIMLPKDYIAYRLSGAFCTDLSDASGMLLLDVKRRRWSEEMLALCGIREDQLPKLLESYEVSGELLPELAAEFGLSSETKIVAGAGDNAAAAVGTGTVGNGDCNISLGTSGTVFLASDTFSVDSANALHSFCHAAGKWHLMGCILSAASCNKWWIEDILKSGDYSGEQEGLEAKLGENEVFFLPYLMGERSPHNDVSARGAYLGMRPDTSRGELTLAVMEGVAFALRDCLEVAKSNGVRPESTKVCGGGAKSALWRKILANVLNLPVKTLATEQGPAYGGAMLAMVGCGEYPSVEAAAEAIVKVRETVLPEPALAEKYERKYKLFCRMYPALKDVFAEM